MPLFSKQVFYLFSMKNIMILTHFTSKNNDTLTWRLILFLSVKSDWNTMNSVTNHKDCNFYCGYIISKISFWAIYFPFKGHNQKSIFNTTFYTHVVQETLSELMILECVQDLYKIILNWYYFNSQFECIKIENLLE